MEENELLKVSSCVRPYGIGDPRIKILLYPRHFFGDDDTFVLSATHTPAGGAAPPHRRHS
jgi:hypothetical protein